MNSGYPQKIRYVELEGGDIYVLPSEFDLVFLEGNLEEVKIALADLQAELDSVPNMPVDKSQLLTILQARVKGMQEQIETARGDIELFADESKELNLEMNRYSWSDKQLAREAARTFNTAGLSTLNEHEFVLSMLRCCILKWDKTRIDATDNIAKPVELCDDEIRNLEPAIFDCIYRLLSEKSEPSQQRLAFRRNGLRGRTKGKRSSK